MKRILLTHLNQQKIKKHKFTFTFKVIKEGFKIIYNNKKDDDKKLIKKIKVGELYYPLELIASEKNTKPVSRYTEASLSKNLKTKV